MEEGFAPYLTLYVMEAGQIDESPSGFFGQHYRVGCPVDADLMTEGENPYENFYDLSLLSEKMNEYYENK